MKNIMIFVSLVLFYAFVNLYIFVTLMTVLSNGAVLFALIVFGILLVNQVMECKDLTEYGNEVYFQFLNFRDKIMEKQNFS